MPTVILNDFSAINFCISEIFFEFCPNKELKKDINKNPPKIFLDFFIPTV